MVNKIAGDLEYLGWIISNNAQNEQVIQKDDEMAVFKSDKEAVEFVVRSYAELLSACKGLLPLGEVYDEDDFHWGDDFTRLEQAIKNAEKYLQKEKTK